MLNRRTSLKTASGLAMVALLSLSVPALGEAYDTSSITVDSELAGRVPARIKDQGVLVIGSDNAYAPWEYLAGDDGQTPEGIDVDFARAIGATLGLDIDFQTSAFDAIIPSLGAKFELGISALSITNARMGVVNFVSYAQSGSLWAVPTGNPANFDPSDICGKMIAVQTGSWFEGILNDESEACVAAGKAALELLPFGAQTEAFTRVAAGGADATIAGDATSGYAVAQSRGMLEAVKATGDILGTSGTVGIAVVKSDDELTQLIADTVNKLIANGTYQAVFDHWGVGTMAIEKSEINPEVTD